MVIVMRFLVWTLSFDKSWGISSLSYPKFTIFMLCHSSAHFSTAGISSHRGCHEHPSPGSKVCLLLSILTVEEATCTHIKPWCYLKHTAPILVLWLPKKRTVYLAPILTSGIRNHVVANPLGHLFNPSLFTKISQKLSKIRSEFPVRLLHGLRWCGVRRHRCS